ncbi:hypothetical protein C1Y63_05865 [Corynebacterium sp. 13CS0277]|nr:hypothetical protein C1Y63_05865 [Corynebacterium sp. 13CS0277]
MALAVALSLGATLAGTPPAQADPIPPIAQVVSAAEADALDLGAGESPGGFATVGGFGFGDFDSIADPGIDTPFGRFAPEQIIGAIALGVVALIGFFIAIMGGGSSSGSSGGGTPGAKPPKDTPQDAKPSTKPSPPKDTPQGGKEVYPGLNRNVITPKKDTYVASPERVTAVQGMLGERQVSKLVLGSKPVPKVGDIYVGEVSESQPHGVLGRIVAIDATGGLATITTEPVTLDDAYDEFSVHVDIPDNLEPIVPPRYDNRLRGGGLKTLDPKVVECDHDNIKIRLGVSVGFRNASVDANLVGRDKGIKFSGALHSEAEIRAKGSTGFTCKTADDALGVYPPLFIAGPITGTFNPRFKFGSVQAVDNHFKVTQTKPFSMSLGTGRFTSDFHLGDGDPEFTQESQAELQLHASAGADLFIGNKIKELKAAVGLELGVRGELIAKLHAKIKDLKIEQCVTLGFSFVASATFTAKAFFFGLERGGEWKVMPVYGNPMCWTIADAEEESPPTTESLGPEPIDDEDSSGSEPPSDPVSIPRLPEPPASGNVPHEADGFPTTTDVFRALAVAWDLAYIADECPDGYSVLTPRFFLPERPMTPEGAEAWIRRDVFVRNILEEFSRVHDSDELAVLTLFGRRTIVHLPQTPEEVEYATAVLNRRIAQIVDKAKYCGQLGG